jgi:two-component system response regulator VanR
MKGGGDMEIRILIVEDDRQIGEMAARYLKNAGYSVDICANGEMALGMLYDKTYQLVILDIMLPGMNGQEILAELRKLHDTPVLMMTALGDDLNQIKAFSNEADDYIVKPFSMPVMVAHAEALLRRSGVIKKEIRVSDLVLYPETCGVVYKGETVQLSPKEFEILLLLVQNKNRIIPHEKMLTRIWGYDFDGNEGIIHASMKKLRDKLPENIIKTVKGLGYCLEINDEN